MSIKKYIVELDYSEVHIVVDHSVVTDEMLHEINNFWSNSEKRLRAADGDVALAVVRLLAETCFSLQFKTGYNSYGVMEEFNYESGRGVEGYPKMDGSMGILISRVDEINFDIDDASIDISCLDKMPAAPKMGGVI